ncbi:MAG: hypothetical protein ACPLRU_02490 [Desulfofundulus sp.]
MPRKCTICEHPQVEEINKALLSGDSLRNIARQFAISKDALFRHRQHLPADMVKAQEAEEVARADSLLDQVTELKDRALAILDKAEQAGDSRTALLAIREAKGCLELLAKLLGELHEQTTVNVLISPQWVSLRAVILQALEPYPEAKLALAQALREVETVAGR